MRINSYAINKNFKKDSSYILKKDFKVLNNMIFFLVNELKFVSFISES